MKVVALWSGGKDSCFAAYLARLKGYRIASLFNFTDFKGINSLSHGLSAQIIREQLTMAGFPFLQKAMPKETYRQEFKAIINEWKEKEDIRGIVFGDIYLQEHKDWIDKVCEELKVEPILPLWAQDTQDLISKFIKTGFKAIVVSTRADLLAEEWLGREINNEFVRDLKFLDSIDPCGEKGEYHTLVTSGPLFKKRIEITKSRRRHKKGRWFLDILEWKIV